MKRRIVVDTNLWIRALLGGPATLPLLEAWRAGQFIVVISQPLPTPNTVPFGEDWRGIELFSFEGFVSEEPYR